MCGYCDCETEPPTYSSGGIVTSPYMPTPAPKVETVAPTTEGSRVFTYVGTMDFEGCVETCVGYGVTMPCLIGPSMNKQYNAQIEADGTEFGWIGYAANEGTDAGLDSSWSWQVGCPSFFADWAPGEPTAETDVDESMCAVTMTGSGYDDDWASGSCSADYVPCYCQGIFSTDLPVVTTPNMAAHLPKLAKDFHKAH